MKINNFKKVLSFLVFFCRTSILSQFTDFANVLKAFIGTSYISLPFAFYQSGLAVSMHMELISVSDKKLT